jgi:hypothetical protein
MGKIINSLLLYGCLALFGREVYNSITDSYIPIPYKVANSSKVLNPINTVKRIYGFDNIDSNMYIVDSLELISSKNISEIRKIPDEKYIVDDNEDRIRYSGTFLCNVEDDYFMFGNRNYFKVEGSVLFSKKGLNIKRLSIDDSFLVEFEKKGFEKLYTSSGLEKRNSKNKMMFKYSPKKDMSLDDIASLFNELDVFDKYSEVTKEDIVTSRGREVLEENLKKSKNPLVYVLVDFNKLKEINKNQNLEEKIDIDPSFLFENNENLFVSSFPYNVEVVLDDSEEININ